MDVREHVEELMKNAEIIENPSDDKLRDYARHEEKTTSTGSAAYTTKIRSRSKKFTELIEDQPNEDQLEFINRLGEYIKDKELLMVDRMVCQDESVQFGCRAYISKEHARLGHLWSNTLFPPTENFHHDFLTVYIPDFQDTPRILVFPKQYLTIVTGTDYVGELKMANLRFAMYKWKLEHGLGFHAGSKAVYVKNSENNIVKKRYYYFWVIRNWKNNINYSRPWTDWRRTC